MSHIYKKRASESILRIKEYTWKFKRRLLNIDIALRGTLSVSSHYEVSKKKNYFATREEDKTNFIKI